MKTIPIPYGRGTLPLNCPESELRGVITCEPPQGNGLSPQALVEQALSQPLGSLPLEELSASAQKILLITSDHTRPVPSHITIPAMLRRIRQGNPNAQIRILVATGCHRATTLEELKEKLGVEVVEQEEVLIHDALNDPMSDKGILPSGCPFLVNALVDWADLIAADGFIEPHFFAGFSGGRKSILPGISSAASVRANHCGKLIHSELSRTGILEGNPIHADMLAAAKMAGLKFILNVVLDDDKQIIAAFAGDLETAHAAGCAHSRNQFTQKGIPASVAVTSNGGYPLDQNIYQSVKSMTAAESCVRPGGMVICCAECSDGHGGESFVRWFTESAGPQDVLDRISRIEPIDTVADQWQSQILARIMVKATVAMVSHEKNRQVIESMGMLWFPDLTQALEYARTHIENYDGITVIPNGVSVILE